MFQQQQAVSWLTVIQGMDHKSILSVAQPRHANAAVHRLEVLRR